MVDVLPQDASLALLCKTKETDKYKYKAKPQFGLKGLNMPESCHKLSCMFESLLLYFYYFYITVEITATTELSERNRRPPQRCKVRREGRGRERRLELGAHVEATPGDSTL